VPGVGFGMNNGSDYDGRGKTSRSGAVKAKVTARIISVYDNGNLLIEGHKEVAINKETEIIKVSGIIRPEDILFDNTIYSFNIADAKITYSGKGDSHHAHRPGIFARFFAWIL
jgi:flagellar L-ring protein precursor FlgH